ncbi:MAG: hypothetical protein ACREIY_03340 [Candidatus Rokuibacteriota bacterium]
MIIRRGMSMCIRTAGSPLKFDLENKQPMKGKASAKILELIEQLEAEGRL